MKIRKMTSKDINLIKELEINMRLEEPDVFPKFNEEKFIKNFTTIVKDNSPINTTFLFIENEKIIGRIDLMIEQSYMDFKKVGYVDWIYTLKSERQKGYAKKLINYAEDFFKKEGCALYYLFVATNEDAQVFYKRIGIEINSIERAHRDL